MAGDLGMWVPHTILVFFPLPAAPSSLCRPQVKFLQWNQRSLHEYAIIELVAVDGVPPRYLC